MQGIVKSQTVMQYSFNGNGIIRESYSLKNYICLHIDYQYHLILTPTVWPRKQVGISSSEDFMFVSNWRQGGENENEVFIMNQMWRK